MTDAESPALRRAFYEAWATRASDQGPTRGQVRQYDGDGGHPAAAARGRAAAGLSELCRVSRSPTAWRARCRSHGVPAPAGARGQAGRAPHRNSPSSTAFAGRKLDAWDITFYSERLQQSRYSVSQEELRDYLPLPRVLRVCSKSPSGCSTCASASAAACRSGMPDARYFEVQNRAGAPLASFYLDAYARPHKRSGAWMDDCIGRKALGGQTIAAGGLPGLQFVAALGRAAGAAHA
jgi:oligopeptidase A